MNKKLLLSVLAIACAVTNMSYGGIFRTLWERTLKPYPTIEEGSLNGGSLDKGMYVYLLRDSSNPPFERRTVGGCVEVNSFPVFGFVRTKEYDGGISFQRVVFDRGGRAFPVDDQEGKLFSSQEAEDVQVKPDPYTEHGFKKYRKALFGAGPFRVTQEQACRKELGVNPSLYRRFTVHHPLVANSLYYSLLAIASVAVYEKLTSKKYKTELRSLRKK